MHAEIRTGGRRKKIVELVFSNSFLILSFTGRIILSFRLCCSVFQEEGYLEEGEERNDASEQGWMDGTDR